MKEKFIVVLGPTAVGKTDLSIDLAHRFEGEIVSCDSMQIYRGMDIGTAKIKDHEKSGIKHHMIDIVDPDEDFSVSQYSKRAKDLIKDINKRGKLPIFVGGTGLYINSLIYDLDFTEVKADYSIRKKYEDLTEEKGKDYVHALLKDRDPESFYRLHPNDSRRVIRALEIYEVTGVAMSLQNKNFKKANLNYDYYLLGMNMDRKKLYDRINLRVDLMMKEGLLEEVQDLLEKGYDESLVSMQAIGYKEIIQYIRGDLSLEESIEILKRNSRRYAKRQLTWFRKENQINWLDAENYKLEEVFECIEKDLKL